MQCVLFVVCMFHGIAPPECLKLSSCTITFDRIHDEFNVGAKRNIYGVDLSI